MTDQKQAVLACLEQGIKLEKRPFLRIARDLGISEEEVIATVRTCLDEGLIRRLAAAVKPHKMGHSVNSLVAWEVPENRIEEVGLAIAERCEISHCYDRECPEGWPWNLFTMIHATSEEELLSIVEEIKVAQGLSSYRMYRSVRELKKTSMRYFSAGERK